MDVFGPAGPPDLLRLSEAQKIAKKIKNFMSLGFLGTNKFMDEKVDARKEFKGKTQEVE